MSYSLSMNFKILKIWPFSSKRIFKVCSTLNLTVQFIQKVTIIGTFTASFICAQCKCPFDIIHVYIRIYTHSVELQ